MHGAKVKIRFDS